MISTLAALMLLGACSSNTQNEHDDHNDHEEMEMNKSHNHSQMEKNHNEQEGKENSHGQHESIQDNFAHQDIIILDKPYQAGEAVNRELEEVVNAYLEMKNALVNDDAAGVDKAAAQMAENVEAVDGSLLQGEGASAWQQHASLYSNKLAKMQHVEDLEEKRSYFSHLSEIVYCTVKSFDLEEMELYATYCPMAFDEKGAYWISETKEISNPYFGSKMLKCGEVKEVL